MRGFLVGRFDIGKQELVVAFQGFDHVRSEMAGSTDDEYSHSIVGCSGFIQRSESMTIGLILRNSTSTRPRKHQAPGFLSSLGLK